MPRLALSDSDVQTYRRRIAEAAARLLEERGESALSMRNIGSELGVSAMTLYRYVEDKRDLLALLQTLAADALAQTQEAAARTADDPVRRLRRLGRALGSFARKQPHAWRILFASDAGAEPPLDRAGTPIRAAFTEAVEKGQLVGDPAALADIYLAALLGLVCLNAGDAARMNTLSAHVQELFLAATTPRVEQASDLCPA